MAQQQSSFLVMIRGLVMLSALIIFPYLALTGHSIPDGLKRFIPSEVKSLVLRLLPQEGSLTDDEVMAEPAPEFNLRPKMTPMVVAIPEGENPSAVKMPSVLDASTDLAFADQSSVYSQKVDASVPSVVAGSAESADQERIEDRLKALGAVAYHLEEWGAGDELYRFVCEVAVDDQQTCRRHFEAIEATPMLAMQKVLLGVEGRLASRR